MATAPPSPVVPQNRLLRALSPTTGPQVLLTLHPVALRLKETLITPDAPITAVYFPLDAVVSVVSTFADGSMREVATIGHEGLVGVPQFLQAGSMPFTAFVQVPGAALQMEAGRFDQTVQTVGSDFAAVLARYTQAWCTQLSQHAVCHGYHRVVQRCARWLLQTHDESAKTWGEFRHQRAIQNHAMAGKELPRLGITGDRRIPHIDDSVLDIGVT